MLTAWIIFLVYIVTLCWLLVLYARWPGSEEYGLDARTRASARRLEAFLKWYAIPLLLVWWAADQVRVIVRRAWP